jgi:hypothetical protein
VEASRQRNAGPTSKKLDLTTSKELVQLYMAGEFANYTEKLYFYLTSYPEANVVVCFPLYCQFYFLE